MKSTTFLALMLAAWALAFGATPAQAQTYAECVRIHGGRSYHSLPEQARQAANAAIRRCAADGKRKMR